MKKLPEIDLNKPVELIILGVTSSNHAQCRLPGTETSIALKTPFALELIPGDTAKIQPRKLWLLSGKPNLSGDVIEKRFDAHNLGLTPLELNDYGSWDPVEEYWRDEDGRLTGWQKEIMAAGPRQRYEMEQVIPGQKIHDPDSDPIYEAVEMFHAGYEIEAETKLNKMLVKDLRCIDAHAHLGSFAFDFYTHKALQYYNAGRQIAELSLPENFNGLLPWGLIDNRPYLRCLHGTGLCLWRFEQFAEAAAIFKKLLWLNPNDNQGARFNLAKTSAGRKWTKD